MWEICPFLPSVEINVFFILKILTRNLMLSYYFKISEISDVIGGYIRWRIHLREFVFHCSDVFHLIH